jgi:hypothetical protein
VVEGARLERVCRGNSTEGSNPSLSANHFDRLRGQAQKVVPEENSSSGKVLGEVPEWSIGPVSKTGDPARDPWVRIPPSPPIEKDGAFGQKRALRIVKSETGGQKLIRRSRSLPVLRPTQACKT